MRWQVCLSGLLALPAIAPPGYCGDRPAEEAVLASARAEEDLVAEPEMIMAADDDAVEAVDIVEGVEFGGFIAAGVEGDEGGESNSPKLSPEEEKALTELIQKAAALRLTQFKKELERKSSALAEKAGLDKAGKEKLEALVPKAAEAAGVIWQQKAREWMLTYMTQTGDVAATLKSWKPETLAGSDQSVAPTAPDKTDVWKAGLKDIVPAAALTTLEEEEKARVAKVREEMADYLNASESRAADTFAGVMDNTLGRIERFGGIDAERLKKLKKTAAEAVKTTTTEWRARAESQLLAMDPKAREQMAKNGGYMGISTADKANQPQEQKAWKDVLAQTLTDAERKLISESRAAVRERRATALATILIFDLDRLIGFTGDQRTAMLKIASKQMLSLPGHYFDPPESTGYYTLDTGVMWRQLAPVTEKEIRPLLTERQMKRWKALEPDQLSRAGYVRERMDIGEVPPVEEIDEFEVERLVSSFLHREAKKMKQKMQSVMESRVDGIARVINPPAETVAVLNTAAKGAAEQMAQSSIANLTSWVRSQFQNIKPADLATRLQNLYNPYFSERQIQADPERWTSTVNRLLSESQRKVWKDECDARDALRLTGLTAMVVTETEKRIALTNGQREKLQKKMDEVIREFDQDFSNFFSYGWHLQGYYSMIPLAMLTDKEMEEVFDKGQAETVKEKCLGNAMQYAEMIRRNHDSRAGRKK